MRWKKPLIIILVLVAAIGCVVVIRQHNLKSKPSNSKVSESIKTNVGLTKQTYSLKSVDHNVNVTDHSKQFMTEYTDSPEGAAVASSFDLLTTANHAGLHSPVKTGYDLAPSDKVQACWVGNENYSSLGGIDPSVVDTINQLDALGTSVTRVGLLNAITSKKEVDPKGIPYTLTVTSALFKVIGNDGLDSYYVVAMQNQVSESSNGMICNLYPTAMQVLKAVKIDRKYNETIRKNYFAE